MKSITFVKRLTEVRKDKKMSQDEVGKLVGVHGAVIGRYEREEVNHPLRWQRNWRKFWKFLWIIS